MFKMPEPYMTVYSKTRNNLSGETLPLYTEAQVKQAVRDALEAAAKVCDPDELMLEQGDDAATGVYRVEKSYPQTQGGTMNLSQLPALREPLANGVFAGITTRSDGTHCAVVLLTHLPDGRLNWQAAMDWAASIEAELPSRPVAALLFANCKPLLAPRWHWTSETDEDDASYAWHCYFSFGSQDGSLKSYEGSAVAVRYIVLEGL